MSCIKTPEKFNLIISLTKIKTKKMFQTASTMT